MFCVHQYLVPMSQNGFLLKLKELHFVIFIEIGAFVLYLHKPIWRTKYLGVRYFAYTNSEILLIRFHSAPNDFLSFLSNYYSLWNNFNSKIKHNERKITCLQLYILTYIRLWEGQPEANHHATISII